MFDRDLQEKIQQPNRTFIGQALERADEARKERKPKPVTLSLLEDVVDTAGFSDFSKEALDLYCKVLKLDDKSDSGALNDRLLKLGLIRKQEDHRLVPTKSGLLLFGAQPRTFMLQAGLLGTIHLHDGGEEPRNFDGPLVLIPQQALQWLRDKLPNAIDRSTARRTSVNTQLFELVREGIVNALVHRDYSIEGAKCQLIVTSNTITVKSAGLPVSPITLDQMKDFSAPMLSRNPVLHYVFAQMELAEERGLGLKSMKEKAKQAELPLPKYTWEDPYLVLTIYRSRMAAVSDLNVGIRNSLSKSEQTGWEWLVTKGSTTAKEYASSQRIPDRTALNHLKHFTDLKLVKKVGSARTTKYTIV
jgi:ATP-dependent DNA helicase RecG